MKRNCVILSFVPKGLQPACRKQRGKWEESEGENCSFHA
jgi:hypothetical protein